MLSFDMTTVPSCCVRPTGITPTLLVLLNLVAALLLYHHSKIAVVSKLNTTFRIYMIYVKCTFETFCLRFKFKLGQRSTNIYRSLEGVWSFMALSRIVVGQN